MVAVPFDQELARFQMDIVRHHSSIYFFTTPLAPSNQPYTRIQGVAFKFVKQRFCLKRPILAKG
jgi:hypothetical protein